MLLLDGRLSIRFRAGQSIRSLNLTGSFCREIIKPAARPIQEAVLADYLGTSQRAVREAWTDVSKALGRD